MWSVRGVPRLQAWISRVAGGPVRVRIHDYDILISGIGIPNEAQNHSPSPFRAAINNSSAQWKDLSICTHPGYGDLLDGHFKRANVVEMPQSILDWALSLNLPTLQALSFTYLST